MKKIRLISELNQNGNFKCFNNIAILPGAEQNHLRKSSRLYDLLIYSKKFEHLNFTFIVRFFFCKTNCRNIFGVSIVR